MIPTARQLDNAALSRVELHVHLDGSLRHETIWELAQKKGLSLEGCKTLQDLRNACVIKKPKDLHHFLKPFCLFVPTIVDHGETVASEMKNVSSKLYLYLSRARAHVCVCARVYLSTSAVLNDLQAIERIAFEFCEDVMKNGVVYVEARYSPHFLLPLDVQPSFEALCEVVRAVNRGFARGEEQYCIKARQIICALVGANMARDVLKLCEHFRGEGVVGIDMAAMSKQDNSEYEEVKETCEEVNIFQEARRLGIHRTVHAGEAGPAEMVKRAVEIYGAERIGHGYHVIEDSQIYSKCLEERMHFETCPVSSFLTGSVPLTVKKHPVVRFAEDNANFSISTDDPTVTGACLQENYDLLWRWGMSEAHFARANMNAAESSFLPENEKKELIKHLSKVFVDGNICGEGIGK